MFVQIEEQNSKYVYSVIVKASRLSGRPDFVRDFKGHSKELRSEIGLNRSFRAVFLTTHLTTS